MRKIRRRPNVDSEIPTASMPDVAFLMVIFFLLTAVFASTHGLNLELPPDGQEAGKDNADPVVVHVAVDGWTVACDPTAPETLVGKLSTALAGDARRPIVLYVERDAPYRHMMQAYELIARALQAGRLPASELFVPTAGDLREYDEAFGQNPFDGLCG